jgi:hypothetical protein
VTVTCHSHYGTCLGYLGRCNRDRIISIYAMPPNVGKAIKASYCRMSLSPALSRQLLPMETQLEEEFDKIDSRFQSNVKAGTSAVECSTMNELSLLLRTAATSLTKKEVKV